MVLINYNVTIGNKEYKVDDGANKCYNEKLENISSPREAWDNMLLFLQKEQHDNRRRLHRDDPIVKIHSIEALQAKNKDDFKKRISEVIRYGGSIYSVSEQAVFCKEYPEGIANNTEKFAKAMAMLETPRQNTTPASSRTYNGVTRGEIIEI